MQLRKPSPAELVDVAARHRVSYDLMGGVVFDGVYLTVPVGQRS